MGLVQNTSRTASPTTPASAAAAPAPLGDTADASESASADLAEARSDRSSSTSERAPRHAPAARTHQPTPPRDLESGSSIDEGTPQRRRNQTRRRSLPPESCPRQVWQCLGDHIGGIFWGSVLLVGTAVGAGCLAAGIIQGVSGLWIAGAAVLGTTALLAIGCVGFICFLVNTEAGRHMVNGN